MKRFFVLFTTLCLLLALCLSFASCAKRETILLTYEKDGKQLTFSSNHYQLLASRAKGSLAASGVTAGGYDATKDAFWDYTDKFDGETVETVDQYQSRRLLESCKFYLAAHVLFQERGLSLPESTAEELKSTLDELMQTDAGGSKAKFNSLLAAYGVNYDLLLDFYRLDEEVDALKESLYGKDASLIGKNLKEEYLKEHYYHLRLIRIDPYTYVYEIDENGDEIYYDAENNKIAYDKTNGVKVVEDNGSVTYRLPDESGEATERYAYDKENGVRALALSSDGSTYEVAVVSDEERDAFLDRVVEFASISTKGEFDEVFAEESARLQSDERAVGYVNEIYLPSNLNDYSILDEIVYALSDMDEGEVKLLDDESGSYYLFCKDAPEEGAYEDEDLAIWFGDFSAGLINSLFEEACRALFPNITVNEEVLQNLPSMKKIEPNYYY